MLNSSNLIISIKDLRNTISFIAKSLSTMMDIITQNLYTLKEGLYESQESLSEEELMLIEARSFYRSSQEIIESLNNFLSQIFSYLRLEEKKLPIQNIPAR